MIFLADRQVRRTPCPVALRVVPSCLGAVRAVVVRSDGPDGQEGVVGADGAAPEVVAVGPEGGLEGAGLGRDGVVVPVLEMVVAVVADALRGDVQAVEIEGVVVGIGHAEAGVGDGDVVGPGGWLKGVVDRVTEGRSARRDDFDVDFRAVVLVADCQCGTLEGIACVLARLTRYQNAVATAPWLGSRIFISAR